MRRLREAIRYTRLSTSTTDESIEAMKKMDNRRIIISVVADDVEISLGSRQAIFTDVLESILSLVSPPQTRKSLFPKNTILRRLITL